MRDRLIDALDGSEYVDIDVSNPKFLVYLMGPYKSYPPYDTPPPEEIDVATNRPTLDETTRRLRRGNSSLTEDDALALLVSLKRDLRENNGVNAFLATDPQISLEAMDAATQSIAYSKAAKATVFVAPAMGDNLGVGIEIGSVCEHLDRSVLLARLAFYSEANVESTMIDAVSRRWHVTVDDFLCYEDLYRAIRGHLRTVA